MKPNSLTKSICWQKLMIDDPISSRNSAAAEEDSFNSFNSFRDFRFLAPLLHLWTASAHAGGRAIHQSRSTAATVKFYRSLSLLWTSRTSSNRMETSTILPPAQLRSLLKYCTTQYLSWNRLIVIDRSMKQARPQDSGTKASNRSNSDRYSPIFLLPPPRI